MTEENSECGSYTIAVENNDNVGDMQPLEYAPGEICKCFYNVYDKGTIPADDRVTSTILKCQGYCRVLERNPSEYKEYKVEMFGGLGDKVMRLPGCCLRKAKVVPLSKKDAVRMIGTVIRSKDGDEYMQVVTVTEDEGIVRVNDVDVQQLLEEFVVDCDGSPCGTIVMLKADEAFGGERGERYARAARQRCLSK